MFLRNFSIEPERWAFGIDEKRKAVLYRRIYSDGDKALAFASFREMGLKPATGNKLISEAKLMKRLARKGYGVMGRDLNNEL